MESLIENSLKYSEEPHTKEEYKNKLDELQKKAQEVFSKMYQGMPQNGMPQGVDPNMFANMNPEDLQRAAAEAAKNMSPEDMAKFANMAKNMKGPTVEEVD